MFILKYKQILSEYEVNNKKTKKEKLISQKCCILWQWNITNFNKCVTSNFIKMFKLKNLLF